MKDQNIAYNEKEWRVSVIKDIKKRIHSLGITQTKLSEIMGISTSTMSRIMNGKQYDYALIDEKLTELEKSHNHYYPLK